MWVLTRYQDEGQRRTLLSFESAQHPLIDCMRWARDLGYGEKFDAFRVVVDHKSLVRDEQEQEDSHQSWGSEAACDHIGTSHLQLQMSVNSENNA